VSGEQWIRGDVRENGKDELVWEFENYGDETGQINIYIPSKEPMREPVLRLVLSMGDPKDFDNGAMPGRCFLPRPFASQVKKVEVVSR